MALEQVHPGLIVWVPRYGCGSERGDEHYAPCLVDNEEEALQIIVAAGGVSLKDVIITRQLAFELVVGDNA